MFEDEMFMYSSLLPTYIANPPCKTICRPLHSQRSQPNLRRPLEEISALFDGEEGSNKIARHGAGGAQAVEDEHNDEKKLDEVHAERISV